MNKIQTKKRKLAVYKLVYNIQESLIDTNPGTYSFYSQSTVIQERIE